MQQDFEEEQAAGKYRIQGIMEEKSLAEHIHQETMRQLEQDTDREIEELKEEKEARLRAERDDKVRLRGMSGIHKRHHEDLKRTMQKKEEDLKNLKEDARKRQETIDKLMHDRELNNQEMKARDKTIGDREQQIYDLKKQNQDLEKYKFVLDYKIKGLKGQIDPKNDDIADMKKQIQAMDSDLEDYHRKNKALKVNIEELNDKQKKLQDEILTQRKRVTDCQTIIKRFKNDLHECVQYIQEPKQLKESVTNLYKKYVPNGIKKQELDSDIQREYNRQRDYLEKSVESLKKKLAKDSEVHRQDNMRVLQENVQLIREINDLRREINFLKHERQQQRLNVERMKKKPDSTSPLPVTEAMQTEIEGNNNQITELRKRIEDQAKLREQAAASMTATAVEDGGQETDELAAGNSYFGGGSL